MKPNSLHSIEQVRARLSAGLLLTILSAPAAAVPLLLEGPISAISANPDGSGSITVLGVVVDIPPGTPITTPTATLTMIQAADTTPLPGRTQPGFLGGTAIIDGDAVAGINTAASLFMEPSENILGADVTSIPPAAIEIAGITLSELNDPRIPADPVTNDFGFEVDPATVPTGVDGVAEGYFSNDGSDVFQYFALSVAGGTLVNAGTTEVSIERAQCLAGAAPGDPIELRVRGAVHDPATGTVTIRDFGPTTFGTVEAVADIPPFGLYNFNLRNDPTFQVCPASVTVEFNGAIAVAAVDGGPPDGDGDGVADSSDNCNTIANTDQRDSNADGYGNACDTDLNNNSVTNTLDLALFRSALLSGPTPPLTGLADDADFNGDGVLNTLDLAIMRPLLGKPPGPSCIDPPPLGNGGC